MPQYLLPLWSLDNPIDIDAILQRRALIARAHQVEDLNVICPFCQAEILDTLWGAANDWQGYGPPSYITFECPDCERELTYHLEWATEIHRVTLCTE